MWHRYVAVGDSFTEGMDDEDPEAPDRFVGWADRLAFALSEEAAGDFAYANLAVRGRLLDDIVGPQLDTALALEPDLVSVVGGGNDLLRPRADLDGLASRLEAAVVRIRATGADVLLATPTDTRHAGVFRALRGRHAVHTANLFSIAGRHGCHVVNLWEMRAIQDWRMWADDRIHLTTEGHRRVAQAALAALGLDAGEAWRVPLPPAAPTTRIAELHSHGEWVRTHLTPWLQRRVTGRSSGDETMPKRPTLGPVHGSAPN